MNGIHTAYLDASALVKLAVHENGTDSLRSFLADYSVRATTWLCLAETLGVLKRKWLRSELTQDQYLAACEDLLAEIRAETLLVEDIGLSSRDVFDEVDRLVQEYPSLDISDALQLATAKRGFLSRLDGESRAILVTADRALAAAASREQLPVHLL